MIRQPTHDLAEQCEQPLGPDPKLDLELWAALVAEPRANPDVLGAKPPAYTGSLDAAMTLIGTFGSRCRTYAVLTEGIKNCSKFTMTDEEFRTNLPRFICGAAVYEVLFMQTVEEVKNA